MASDLSDFDKNSELDPLRVRRAHTKFGLVVVLSCVAGLLFVASFALVWCGVFPGVIAIALAIPLAIVGVRLIRRGEPLTTVPLIETMNRRIRILHDAATHASRANARNQRLRMWQRSVSMEDPLELTARSRRAKPSTSREFATRTPGLGRGAWLYRAVAIVIGLALFGTAACASSRTCPPIGLSAPAASQSLPTERRAISGRHAPLQRLATSVDAIECQPSGFDSGATREALANLAEALDLRNGPADVGSQKIRTAAQALASGSTAPSAVRHGLEAALQTLLKGPEPAGARLEYRGAVAALERSLDAVVANDGASCESARDALRAATNAVFLALAGEPPFEEATIAPRDAKPLTSMGAGIEPARAAVLALGEAPWHGAREPAAQALRHLAAMVSAADCARAFKRNVSDIRLQAERLTLGDSLSHKQSYWIKSGLLSALDGLALVSRSGPSEERAGHTPSHVGSAWLTAARQAVAHIDAQDLLAFQRSAIQDAFRATIDAFVFAAQQRPECQQ